MNFPAHPPRQQSYLLRCLETRSSEAGTPSTWRFTLQDLRTGSQTGFRDLATLLAHLQAELPEADDESQADPFRTVSNPDSPGTLVLRPLPQRPQTATEFN